MSLASENSAATLVNNLSDQISQGTQAIGNRCYYVRKGEGEQWAITTCQPFDDDHARIFRQLAADSSFQAELRDASMTEKPYVDADQNFRFEQLVDPPLGTIPGNTRMSIQLAYTQDGQLTYLYTELIANRYCLDLISSSEFVNIHRHPPPDLAILYTSFESLLYQKLSTYCRGDYPAIEWRVLCPLFPSRR